MQRIHKSKSWFFKSISDINKSLDKITKRGNKEKFILIKIGSENDKIKIEKP